VVPADEPYARTRAIRVRDEASVRRVGPREGSEVVPGLITRAALVPVAERLLARLAARGTALTLELANEDRIFERFAAGDTITVVLPSCGARLRLATRVLAYDTETDLLTVTGEAADAED
jgi:hypothetical protein